MENIARPELLHVADTVARDKGITKEDVLFAIEQSIQKAARIKYGMEYDIRASIDRRNGAINLARYVEVVEVIENVEDEAKQILLKDAVKKRPEISVGEFIVDPLPELDFGRIAAQTTRQVMVQKVREAERMHQYEEFKDRVGEIVNGIVKRSEGGNIVIELGKAEALLRREELIPREMIRNNERIRALLFDVRPENRGPQLFLSRSHPNFMAKLFMQEVPEIYDGIIEIKAVARDPGSRAKMAVTSKDSSIDPVGACVGMRGVRVQAVVNELQGEKVDIIQWSSDPATLVVNALAPAEVSKVVLDEEKNSIEVVVPDDQFSLAIGRRGQNVRLASQLCGWHIDIMTENEESERRQGEMKTRSQLFIDALDVDEVIAHLLVGEGFSSVDEVALVPIEEIETIEGFDTDVANELQKRASAWLDKKNAEYATKLQDLKLAKEVMDIAALTPEMQVKLGEAGIKTMDDIGDLAADEMVEIVGAGLDEETASTIIMDARSSWFDEEEKTEE